MKAFRFRILFPQEEGIPEVFRDIEIGEEQSFEDLHQILVTSFALRTGEMASFYLSDEKWEKNAEIPLLEMAEEGQEEAITMRNAKIGQLVATVGQKLVYVYDFLRMWTFLIDTLAIEGSQKEATYPRLIHSEGELPPEEVDEYGIPVLPPLDANVDKDDKRSEIQDLFDDLEEDDKEQFSDESEDSYN